MPRVARERSWLRRQGQDARRQRRSWTAARLPAIGGRTLAVELAAEDGEDATEIRVDGAAGVCAMDPLDDERFLDVGVADAGLKGAGVPLLVLGEADGLVEGPDEVERPAADEPV